MTEKFPEMISFSHECIPCALGSVINLFNNGVVPEKDREDLLREALHFLSEMPFDRSPLHLGRDLHRLIRKFLNNPDPYAGLKQKYNSLLLDRYDELMAFVKKSENPFDAALRLAIAGNVIDFVSNNAFNLGATLERAKTVKFAVDDSQYLEKDIRAAKTLLYLGDNAGEIVLDRVFLEILQHPNVYFAVRGNPIINDATRKEAEQVKMGELAKVIDNGNDAPGTILPDTSDEFREIFYSADLIISKGQGNFESLMKCTRPIYFLLMSKCNHVSEILGVKKGDFIVKKTF